VALYINNFRGRAGRLEQAKHIVREFDAIEAAFAKLQALNVASYLTIYTNSTVLTGTVTIQPDNGYLQELTLTSDTSIEIAVPLNESQYRLCLLIHGSGYTVTNLWGAQTWKEYGLGSWWDLYCGNGEYASMMLEFYWDICDHTWICVAFSKNQMNTFVAGTAQRFYPLHCNLWNIEHDDQLGFSRASFGMTIDDHQAYHFLRNEEPRFHGARYIDNWCATPSDLTSVGWTPTDCTVTTDTGAGPSGQDVQRLSFDVTGGRLAAYVLPAFGRASTQADSIKVAVRFKGQGVNGPESVRVRAAFMGKVTLDPPVHDQVQVDMTASWEEYGCVLDVTKEDNATTSMALDREYPRTLIEIAFVSPSGSAGGDIRITDVQFEVLRGTDEETVQEIVDGGIGASMTLTSSGTGSWVDGTKTMTLATPGEYVDFSANLEVGKSYLVHPRLQSGDACDIRMVNELTVWAAGLVSDDLYLQDAPFVFQYDGGILKFVLVEGTSSIYLVDIYELTGQHSVSCYQNLTAVSDNGALFEAIADPPIPVSSGILDGVAREIASSNLIPYAFFRTFTAWDQAGLTGHAVNDCRTPVFQSEYGIDQWPARATILQGASTVTDGFIQRLFSIPASVQSYDFQMWIRRTFDEEGNQIYFPQHNDVKTPISRYVDFEAELTGGSSIIGGPRIRLDLQTGNFVTSDDTAYDGLGIYEWDDWYHIVVQISNDGTHTGFRVRVYPSSADDPDPNVIDVTNTGWVIIDWAQFEVTGGTYGGSSPIIGAMTRDVEDFTSGLQDGYFYRLDNMTLVATLTAGDLIWVNADGVYENLLYSTSLQEASVVSRNMHEFGLVEAETPALPNLVVATTTPYPIEAVEALDFSVTLESSLFMTIPFAEFDVSFAFQSGTLEQILLSAPTQTADFDTSFTLNTAVLNDLLLVISPQEAAFDTSFAFLSGELVSKLVSAFAPDEALDFSLSLIDGTLTTV